MVVPLLVRAGREDEDGGEGFLSTLFTVVVVALVVVTVIGELAAPLLMHLYLSDDIQGSERRLAVTFTRLFLPQLLFYALTALFSAVLTIRGRFGAVGLVPAANNVVVIAVTAVFFFTPRHTGRTWASLDSGQTLLLGLGDHPRRRRDDRGAVARRSPVPASGCAGAGNLREPRLRAAARLGGWVFRLCGLQPDRLRRDQQPRDVPHRQRDRVRDGLPAVPVALRDRRRLGHQRDDAAAVALRARRRPPAGPRRAVAGAADGRPCC